MMNHRYSIALILVLLMSVLLFSSGCTSQGPSGEKPATPTAQAKTYVVGIDAEYPPYSFIDSNGTATGFDVESMRWIAAKEGFNVTFQPTAWDGIIPSLQAGKLDIIYSGMTITDERKEKVSFSIPYLKINQSVAVHKDSNFTMADLLAGKLVVGAQRGTTGAFWVEDNLIDTGKMPAQNLKVYDNFPLVATDLSFKRIDAAIYDRPPLQDAIAGKPLVIIGEIDTGEEYGVALRKDDTGLLATINSGLTALMQDPYWQELKVKYGLA
jgi:polar amino acid transport system substrate-binding protein